MRYLLLTVLLLASGTTAVAGESPRPPAARPRLGINLAGPADWNTELPFVDVFRMSRPWVSQRKGQPWGKGPKLDVDARGWVRRLEPDCFAETLMCTIDGGHYPSGRYTVLYEGKGKLDAGGAGKVASSEPGRVLLDVDSTKGAIFLRLLETDEADPVRNIRAIMPGFEKTCAAEPFHPAFLARWRGVACIRFMDWMETNNSKVSTWDQRPRPDDATFSERGVPVEVMADLCNRLKADAWFCLPHLADDGYARGFAAAVKAKLDPSLKVYVEYSNEVWNSQFQQTRWTWEQAKQLGVGPKERPWEGGGMLYAKRSVEIFRVFEEVFGGRDRLVRVLAWQSGNAHWMRNIVLPYQEAYKHADALAIAPYMGFNVPREARGGKGHSADVVATWTVEQALDHMENESLPQSIKSIRETKKVADEFGLKLVAYEGGQHMVGVGGGENVEAMTKLFHAANAHERMGRIYDRYLEAWVKEGGDVFCHFSSVGRWSKWGSWGTMQHADDDPARSPKHAAIMRWAKGLGQEVMEGR